MYDIDERVRQLKYRIQKFKRKHKHLYGDNNENEIVDITKEVVPRTKKIVREEPKTVSNDKTEIDQEEINFQRALRAALKKTKNKQEIHMLNALREEHKELEYKLENDTLTDEERREIKKEKLKLKDQIARIENQYDYDQHGGGIEYFGYNGAQNALL